MKCIFGGAQSLLDRGPLLTLLDQASRQKDDRVDTEGSRGTPNSLLEVLKTVLFISRVPLCYKLTFRLIRRN